MATKGVPTNPPDMRRRLIAHTPSQAYEIDLFRDGAWQLVGYSQHLQTATPAVYWNFTSVQGVVWTEPANRHYFGMLRLKSEYGVSMQLAGAAIAEEAQAEAAKADGLPVGDGPGRENDPLVRSVVERYAVDRTKEWLEDQDWVCEVIGKPFDLRCTKGDKELHAEVKGTQGEGKVVELTKNEVIHNQELCKWGTACDEQALFVVSGITVTGPTPKGGKLAYAWPWKITSTVLYDDNGDLIPDLYKYTVPELTVVAP
jgi:hypothetical protein